MYLHLNNPHSDIHSMTELENQLRNNQSQTEEAFSVFILLGGSVSLVGLAFAFITYSLFSDWRDFGGTSVMNLLASLFLGQLLHIIGIGDPSLLQVDGPCLTLTFLQHYMWSSQLFWVFAVGRDVQQRLVKVHGISQISSKKIHRTGQEDNSFSQELLGSYSTSMVKSSILYWGLPLILTLAAIAMEIRFPYSPQPGHCWFLGHSLWALILTVLLPAGIMTMATFTTVLHTWTVARGARHLLLSTEQFNYVYQRLLFVVKLILLLVVTLTLGIGSTLSSSIQMWTMYHVMHSLQGLVTSLALTCNCNLVKSFAHSGIYFHKKKNNKQYGTGDVVAATSLNLLVWNEEPNVV